MFLPGHLDIYYYQEVTRCRRQGPLGASWREDWGFKINMHMFKRLCDLMTLNRTNLNLSQINPVRKAGLLTNKKVPTTIIIISIISIIIIIISGSTVTLG